MKQETMAWQWHQLDHMQIMCTSLQTYNHANTPSLNFFTGQMLSLTTNQQCQSTEGRPKYCFEGTGLIAGLQENLQQRYYTLIANRQCQSTQHNW